MKNVIKARFGGMKTDENGDIELIFTVDKSCKSVIIQIVREIREHISRGKDIFKLTVSEYRNSRSADQNRIMWALLEKRALHMNGGRTGGVTAWDCYCDMVEQFGAGYEYIMVLPEAERVLKEGFRAVRFVKKAEHNGTPMNIYKCYYGSSTYNTKEMTLLIEGIFDRLAELGADDAELYDMRDDWVKGKIRVTS